MNLFFVDFILFFRFVFDIKWVKENRNENLHRNKNEL